VTTEDRKTFTREEILRILNDVGSYMVPEDTLKEWVYKKVLPPPTKQEILTELAWLESNDFVTGVNPEMGGPRKWRITDKGRTCVPR